MLPLLFGMQLSKVLKWILILNIYKLKFITPIIGFLLDKFVEIKMGFDRSLHKICFFSFKIWFSIDSTVDNSLYIWTYQLEFDHLETL